MSLIHPVFTDGDITKDTRNGQIALLWAASRGHHQIVSALIDQGAKLDIQDNLGHSALMLAALRGHSNTVARLLSAGANAKLENNGGIDAQQLARKKGHNAIVELIERQGT